MAATNIDEVAIESATTEQWQAHMKKWLEPEADEDQQAVLAILRDLLLAPETEDRSPAQAAAEKLLKLYHDNYLKEDFGFHDSDDKGASAYLDTFSSPVVELATLFKWDSAGHQRLVDTMIALRDGCAEKFDEEDPQLVYDAEGVLGQVESAWNSYSVTPSSGLPRCYTSVNMTALFSKLFGAGLYDRELKYALCDLEDGLDKSVKGDRERQLRQRAHEAMAALWCSFGGSILAQVTRDNASESSRKQFPDVFNKQRWKGWVSRLADIARDAPDDAEFDLKQLASKAHDRMVQLQPEVLEPEI